MVFSIAPSPLQADVIWAGSDTGLLHLTRDGGKNWQDVTPPGFHDWSKIAMIEASHFDPAVAYVAVDRHRLDDDAPTSIARATTEKPGSPSLPASRRIRFSMRFARTRRNRDLLFAATELGIYVSFDEGDHWQPLQLNLPATSVRDVTIHGDDLIIATHGRGFWILDDITALRQLSHDTATQPVIFFAPEITVRVDNDSSSEHLCLPRSQQPRILPTAPSLTTL